MHQRFVDLLCCPDTGESLALESAQARQDGMIVGGFLRSTSGRRYPILRGIPRFVAAEQYAASFGFEWNRWPRVQFESENVGRPMQGHTTHMWERITGATDPQVAGRTIVDFGCGAGRFLDVVRRKGGIAVGIDLSGAVECARRNFADDPNVLIVQGDLTRPPFRSGAFDGGFSIGVLHHTPNAASGAAALARSIRPGGWISCCVYPKGDFYDFPSVGRFRWIHRHMEPFVGYRFALAYSHLAARVLAPIFHRAKKQPWLSPLVRHLERRWLVSLYLKDARWRVLDTFDAITPRIASTHTFDEVRAWLEQAGCTNVVQTPWCPTSVAAQCSAITNSNWTRSAA
jgi:SAM-dependent methyltransferase